MGQQLIEGTSKLLLHVLKQLVALELKEDSEEFKEMIWTSLPNTQPDHLNTAIHALNTCQLTNFSFSPKELLFGMVVNTKKTLLKEAAPILKEMDVTTHMAYIAQQQLDGYDWMVQHTIRHKNTFDKRVIWESGKEIVFEAGDLVQVYRSNMDHTFKTKKTDSKVVSPKKSGEKKCELLHARDTRGSVDGGGVQCKETEAVQEKTRGETRDRDRVRAGDNPWTGIGVHVISGHCKSSQGFVQNAQKIPLDGNILSSIKLTVELAVVSPGIINPLITTNYLNIQEIITGKHLMRYKPLTCKQSEYYALKFTHEANLMDHPYSHDASLSKGKHPKPVSAYAHNDDNDILAKDLSFIWDILSIQPESDEPAPGPSVPLSSTTNDVISAHWILHPKLVNIPIIIDIKGGKHDTESSDTGITITSE
uniref:Uncharacterized protein n=1 Tax=Moniliophthora roreri TaxID=221103 RepID=A0A0W0FET2_MONRR